MSYPVIQIPRVNVLYDEQMGTKDKDWCRHPTDERLWLFKHPRLISDAAGFSGEHWAEKLAAELGTLLGVPVAQVELAEIEGQRGSLSRNILTGDHQAMVHGNELLAGHVTGYDKELKRGQNEHTWKNILEAIHKRCGEAPCQEILEGFAGYLVLDAWIANTDRHHQNWALLQTQEAHGVRYQMCPSFDHASSLGRELTDDRRRELLAAGIDRYRHHKNARGAIYWEAADKHPVHQLELVRRICHEHLKLVVPWLERLARLSVDEWTPVIHDMPDSWMSPDAKTFALVLIEANRHELLTCLTN